MPSIRPVRAWSCVIAVAGLVSLMLGCSSSDATTPSQPVADDAWVRATFTLLDELPPCDPNIACAPEVYDCTGSVPITVPRTWILNATSATAGMANYNAYIPASPPTVPNPTAANGTLSITATDVLHDTALAIEINLVFDVNGALTSATLLATGNGANANFANTAVSCTHLNPAGDPVTLFSVNNNRPFSATITSVDVVGTDIEFARQQAGGFSPAGIVEGRFSFEATNFQQVIQIYSGSVRVDGCFRLNLPRFEQGIPVVAAPAACP